MEVNKIVKIAIAGIIGFCLLYLFFHKNENEINIEIKNNAINDSAEYRNIVNYMKSIRDTLNKGKEEECNDILVFSNAHSMFLRTKTNSFKLNDFRVFNFLSSNRILSVKQCNIYTKFELSKYGNYAILYDIYYSNEPLSIQQFTNVRYFEKISDKLYLVVRNTNEGLFE